MLHTLKNELKQRDYIAESAELDDEILIDEMDDDILLDEEDVISESSMSDIERAIEMIPVDETDIAYEEMDELLEACCGQIEESAEEEGDAPISDDPEISEDYFMEDYFAEECEACDETEDQDYNNYRGRGASHAGGYCEGEDLEDFADEEMDELSEAALIGLYFE